MGTVRLYFAPEEASFRSTLAFPNFVRNDGSGYGVTGLAYATGATNHEAQWKFEPVNYGSGNLTVDVLWYAASGTTGAVDWYAKLAAITPNTDVQDVQTKTFPSGPIVTTNHLGTTARRLHKTTLTLSGAQLDSVAAGDEAWLAIGRSSSTDTLAADAILTSVRLSYSDT